MCIYIFEAWIPALPPYWLANKLSSKLFSSAKRERETSLCFLREKWTRWHPSIYMFITEPAVPSKRILGLGSTLYLSNMQRMLNNSLSRFIQSLLRVRQNRLRKEKLCCQGATVRKKNLTVNCNIASNVRIKNQMFQYTCVQFAFLILSKATPSKVNEYKK